MKINRLSIERVAAQIPPARCPLLLSAFTLFAGAGSLQAAAVMGMPPAFLGAADVQSASSPNLTLGFNINLNFINAPNATEAAAFASAEAIWESTLAGYQIDDIFSTTVTIDVNLTAIDGVGGTLGSAGPQTVKLNAAQTNVTPTFLYTETGAMTFDTADLPGLGGTLNDVILHEMGHVLGVGTLWSSSGVGIGGRQELYVANSGEYTGGAGLAAYNAEFSQVGAFVPVELGGGAGTANGHWNEVDNGAGLTGITSNIQAGPDNDIRNELMTGWLNGPTFMSTLTSEGMVDLGYAVVPEPSIPLIGSMGFGLLILNRRRKY